MVYSNHFNIIHKTTQRNQAFQWLMHHAGLARSRCGSLAQCNINQITKCNISLCQLHVHPTGISSMTLEYPSSFLFPAGLFASISVLTSHSAWSIPVLVIFTSISAVTGGNGFWNTCLENMTSTVKLKKIPKNRVKIQKFLQWIALDKSSNCHKTHSQQF